MGTYRKHPSEDMHRRIRELSPRAVRRLAHQMGTEYEQIEAWRCRSRYEQRQAFTRGWNRVLHLAYDSYRVR